MINRIFIWIDEQGYSHSIMGNSLSQIKQQLLLNGDIFITIKMQQRVYARSFDKPTLILLTRQLATMLKAGLPIIESLNLLIKENNRLHWQHVLQELKNGLLQGKSLSQLIAQQTLVFPIIYQQIIATAELTGRLEEGFVTLANTLDETHKQQKQIKKALRYPLFLLLATIIVILIMLLLVLPQFASIYQSFDAKLPFITQLIMDLSHVATHYLPILLFIIILTIICYRYYVSKHYKIAIERLQLRLPIIKNLITHYYLSVIFQTLALTEQSGIPLLSGLRTARNNITHHLYQKSLNQIIESLEQGFSFHHTLQQQIYYPTLIKQLIRIGEESGTLDDMFYKIAEHYKEQYEEKMHYLTKQIEPLMMSLMAIIIGGLVIAIYLPIFQLGGIIH